MNINHIKEYALRFVTQLSTKALYSILLLYFAYNNSDTPAWAKRIIIGTIGYFLSPIDSIPDLTPLVGFTDDFGVLSFGIATIACYITNDVRIEAADKLNSIFPTKVDPIAIKEVDEWL